MRQQVAEGIADVNSNDTKAPKDILRVLFVDVPKRFIGRRVANLSRTTPSLRPT